MKQRGSFTKMLTCAVLLGAALLTSTAEAAVGKAVVRAVRGSADYSDGSGSWLPLKTGRVLKPGAVIRTSADSQVDLFLDQNGPVVRVTESSQLAIERLSFESTGADTVIDTGLDLRSGRVLGNVKKMAEASKYEVKTPNGVAGIRGTEYDISADGKVVVLDGSVVVVFVKADGTVITQVVNAGQTFDPATGIVRDSTPQEIQNARNDMITDTGDGEGTPVITFNPDTTEPTVSTITGGSESSGDSGNDGGGI